MDIWDKLNWKKLTVNVILGYAISWVVFFYSLDFFQNKFGKVNGTIYNYILSVIIWLGSSYILQIYNPSKEKKSD